MGNLPTVPCLYLRFFFSFFVLASHPSPFLGSGTFENKGQSHLLVFVHSACQIPCLGHSVF